MSALIEVILPVFLVIGFGYIVVWRGLLNQDAVETLMKFSTNFAVPCLLFRAISQLDLGQNFNPLLLLSYYVGATLAFAVGTLGTRFLFRRAWEDSIAVGFACLFANSLLLGLPITERAYGTEALGANFALISIHAPYCYLLGVISMEVARNRGGGVGRTVLRIVRSLASNPLVIGIALGVVANFSGVALPGTLTASLDMMARTAIPVALFALGGVLHHYKPEGDLRLIAYVMVIVLVMRPIAVWTFGKASGLPVDQFRSAVLTASMPPGINAYLFASMYGVAKRVAASSVLFSTAAAVLTVWFWLYLLP